MESRVPLPSLRRGQGMASCRWPLVLRGFSALPSSLWNNSDRLTR